MLGIGTAVLRVDGNQAVGGVDYDLRVVQSPRVRRVLDGYVTLVEWSPSDPATVEAAVHGLAGSAAVALLVLASIRDARWAIAYLLVFGIGTIAGMMVISMTIASSFRLARGKQPVLRRLAVASGALSLAFGVFVAYHIVAVNGLLSAHPQWTPR